MPVFDAATAIMSGVMMAWNIFLFILKATLIAGLTMMVVAPGSYVDKFFFQIFISITYLFFKAIISIQTYVFVELVKVVSYLVNMLPVIVNSPSVTQISNLFSTIAFALITAFFLYQVVKNTFAHLGFDGEATFNTILVYILAICILLFLNSILTTLLQITFDISVVFTGSVKDIGEAFSSKFSGFISGWGGNDSLLVIATNVLAILIFAKLISSFIALGYSIASKIVTICIFIMIGPLAVSFSILKSMRSSMVIWFKGFLIANTTFIMYSVMLFFISNASADIVSSVQKGDAHIGDLAALFILVGLASAFSRVEEIVASLFNGMASGGSSNGGPGFGEAQRGFSPIMNSESAVFNNLQQFEKSMSRFKKKGTDTE